MVTPIFEARKHVVVLKMHKIAMLITPIKQTRIAPRREHGKLKQKEESDARYKAQSTTTPQSSMLCSVVSLCTKQDL